MKQEAEGAIVLSDTSDRRQTATQRISQKADRTLLARPVAISMTA